MGNNSISSILRGRVKFPTDGDGARSMKMDGAQVRDLYTALGVVYG